MTRYWSGWEPGEEKAVKVPAVGNVERVDVTGTLTDPATGQAKAFDLFYEWGAAKPAAPPGK